LEVNFGGVKPVKLKQKYELSGLATVRIFGISDHWETIDFLIARTDGDFNVPIEKVM
jgi:hypothetical protein